MDGFGVFTMPQEEMAACSIILCIYLGGAAAPFFVLTLGAQVIGGFSGAFVVMGVSGLITAALLSLSTRATRRSLESVAR
jgi:hypothetical protein